MRKLAKSLFVFSFAAILTACGMPKADNDYKVENNADVSTQMVSESEMSANGCKFKKVNAYVHVLCAEALDVPTQFKQKMSIVRYSQNFEKWLASQNIKTPSGKIINEKSMKALSDKGMAAYIYIHGFKMITGNTYSYLIPADGTSEDDRQVLQFLLRIAEGDHAISTLKGQTIEVDCSRCTAEDRADISESLESFLKSTSGNSEFKKNVVTVLRKEVK